MISFGFAIAGIAGLAISALLGVLLTEVPAVSRWLAPKVVRQATRRLPERVRVQKEEEWLAELETMEGIKVFRMIYALGCFWAAVRIRRAEPSPAPSQAADREYVQVFLNGVGYSLKANVSREELWSNLAATAGLVGSPVEILELESRDDHRRFVTVSIPEIGSIESPTDSGEPEP